MSEKLDIAIEGRIARLRFHNPPHNHATVALLRKLADALEKLDSESQVRAIILASEGRSFCAGADLLSSEGLGGKGADPLREFYDQALRIYQTRKPVIAAVQGAAVGAGLGLAVAADFRIASEQARFAANFVKLGFHPGFGLTYTLPQLIGRQKALRMFLTGARYKAQEVLDWGLIDQIVPADQLDDAAREFAVGIAENAPLALLSTRATLRAGIYEQVAAALTHEHHAQLSLKDTKDFAEGVRAVAERRPGQFVGR